MAEDFLDRTPPLLIGVGASPADATNRRKTHRGGLRRRRRDSRHLGRARPRGRGAGHLPGARRRRQSYLAERLGPKYQS